MRFALTALPLIALAAPVAAQAQYRGVGTEPFWSLTIDARAMRFEEPGERPVTVARPAAQTSASGQRFVARGMTVDIIRAQCGDGMSDRLYPNIVLIRIGERSLRGCGSGSLAGGRAAPVASARPTAAPVVARPTAVPAPPRPATVSSPTPPSPPAPSMTFGKARPALADSYWTVWQVNGRAIEPPRPLLVHFTGDVVEGKLCNLFRASYALTGEQFQAGAVTARRATCQGPEAAAETKLFAMLRGPVRATVSRWGTLVLTSGRDTITLRPFP